VLKLPRLAYMAFIFGLVILVVGVLALLITSQPTKTTLTINQNHYQLTIARTTAQLEQGLGGRPSLPADQGMLFEFNKTAQWCFWMKDMHFPIDMIWLNQNKQVVYIKPDALPSSYTAKFCPTQSAKYVIELKAGTAQADQLRINSKLRF